MVEMQYYQKRNGYLLCNYDDLNLVSGGARVSQIYGGALTSKRGALADPRGGARDARPPGGPNSFIFMQFSEKN